MLVAILNSKGHSRQPDHRSYIARRHGNIGATITKGAVMRIVVVLAVLLTACGGQGTQNLVGAFDAAGVPLEERELRDGRTAWSSPSGGEDVLIEVIGNPIEEVSVMVPALRGDVSETFPGSRYVKVVDDTLAPGVLEWIVEEAAGRSSGSWSASRDFGSWTVEIENDPELLGMFIVALEAEE